MNSREQVLKPDELIPIVAVVLALLVGAWLLPVAASLAHARAWPDLNAGQAVAGTVRVLSDGHAANPRRAYPRPARATMPRGKSWWLAAGGPFVLLAAGAWVGWRRLEPLRARALLGRRVYDPRGSDPREWARPRDLRALIVKTRTPGRFTLGQLDGRLLASDAEAHAAVIAPTRSGKTTRCIIPWLLEHDGPAVVTSTKRDLVQATGAWRAEMGEVHVWDPGAPDSASWTPLDRCEEWGYAIRQGLWLADAVGHGDHQAARFWNGEAAKLLAPLLHAAALGPNHMEAVIGWLDEREIDEPTEILAAGGAPAAARLLGSIAGLDDRNRGTIYMSAGALIGAYRHPDVLATARPGFDPVAFLDGGAHTLYICLPARRQTELAPLVVSMLSTLLETAAYKAAAQGAPLSPTLRILLDEAANIAPLSELPGHLSQAAAHGVRIATVWQSLAQARERYGDAADAILANSTAKLFMGPITDNTTRAYVEQLLGQELAEHDDHHAWRPKAPAQALQQPPRPSNSSATTARCSSRGPSPPRWSSSRRSGRTASSKRVAARSGVLEATWVCLVFVREQLVGQTSRAKIVGMKVFRTTVGVAGELDIPRVARDQLMPGSEILIVVGDANFEGARERESRGDPVGEERDPKQQWFWSDEWQAGEREVDEQIARGEVTHLEDAGELMAFLDRHRET